MNQDNEIWKAIPNIEGYEASNLGRIRSYRIRGSRGKLSATPKILKPLIDKKTGYAFVHLSGNKGAYLRRKIQTLVMLAFIGPRPEGLNILHKDDNKLDNRLDNLRYGTQKENVEDMIKHHNGIHPMRKYTVKRKPRIFTWRTDFIKVYNNCDSLNEIANKTGLKKKTVMEVASRLRRWGYNLQYFRVQG